MHIRGHLKYDSIEINERIDNLYASSFTIIIKTESNNFYYIGKNPTYET